jgi:hypothetical protein
MRLLSTLALLVPLLVGCATSFGPIAAPPIPTNRHPIKVSLHRVESIEGAEVPLVFLLNGIEIYGLRNGETYRFELDPGQYVFGWTFGLDTCSQDVWLPPGRDVTLTLSNDCDIPSEP